PRIPYFGINHHEAMPRSALRATQRPVPAFRRRGDYALSEIPRRSGEPSATGAGVILSDDVLRNPTPVGDLLALGAGPLPNGAVLLTIHRLRPPTPGRGARRRHGNPADLGPRLDVRLERFPQLGCVLRRQIDLVLHTVEAKLDGLVSLGVVEVVNQPGNRLFCHCPDVLPFRPQASPWTARPRVARLNL